MNLCLCVFLCATLGLFGTPTTGQPVGTNFGKYSQWSVWSSCKPECTVGVRTRERVCDKEPCIGQPKESASCTTACGCNVYPCGNRGTCIPAKNPKMYTCACHYNYAGNNSQNCATKVGSSAHEPLLLTREKGATVASPFYPATYPPLSKLKWVINSTYSNLIAISHGPNGFNLNATVPQQPALDYLAVSQFIINNGVGLPVLSSSEFNKVQPCIYDMLIITEGLSTDIDKSIGVYCNAKPLPSKLLINARVLTIEFRSLTPVLAGSHFSIEMKSVSPCAISPCSNSGTCLELGNGGYRCLCSDQFTGFHCERRAANIRKNSRILIISLCVGLLVLILVSVVVIAFVARRRLLRRRSEMRQAVQRQYMLAEKKQVFDKKQAATDKNKSSVTAKGDTMEAM